MQSYNAVFICSVDVCFIFIEQINFIFMPLLYEAVILYLTLPIMWFYENLQRTLASMAKNALTYD